MLSSNTRSFSSFPLPLPLPFSSPSLHSITIRTGLLLRANLTSTSTSIRSLSSMEGAAAAATSDARSAGPMVFEPILEEGVFRFDCSADHRAEAYPSLSFADQTVRETPINPVSFKVPEFVPYFECAHGQQKVEIKVCSKRV